MVSPNQATKAYCTLDHPISTSPVADMAYTITAPTLESSVLDIFDTGCSD